MSRSDPDLPLSVPGLAQRAFGGSLLMALGVAMLVIAWDYPMGRVSDMGPGFVPIWAGIALTLMGLAILVSDLRPRPMLPQPQVQWRGLAFVSAAVLIFAALIEPMGLVPSMFAAVAVSKLADPVNRPLSIILYAALSALAGWLLFLVILELPIPAFWR